MGGTGPCRWDDCPRGRDAVLNEASSTQARSNVGPVPGLPWHTGPGVGRLGPGELAGGRFPGRDFTARADTGVGRPSPARGFHIDRAVRAIGDEGRASWGTGRAKSFIYGFVNQAGAALTGPGGKAASEVWLKAPETCGHEGSRCFQTGANNPVRTRPRWAARGKQAGGAGEQKGGVVASAHFLPGYRRCGLGDLSPNRAQAREKNRRAWRRAAHTLLAGGRGGKIDQATGANCLGVPQGGGFGWVAKCREGGGGGGEERKNLGEKESSPGWMGILSFILLHT